MRSPKAGTLPPAPNRNWRWQTILQRSGEEPPTRNDRTDVKFQIFAVKQRYMNKKENEATGSDEEERQPSDENPVEGQEERSDHPDHEQLEEETTGPEGPDHPDETDDPDPLAQLPRPDFTSLRIRMFNVSCFFYLAMGGIGLFWMNGQGILSARLSTASEVGLIVYSLAAGAACALVVFALGALVRRTSEWAVDFEKEFAPLVNVFSYAQVPVLAFVSAAGEELFFRGALQEGIGLFAAALLFGLIHFPWKKIMIPWPVFAFVLGLAFGYIVDWTGSLYGPFLGHFLINLVNITLIKRRHPMQSEDVIDELMSG